jgi:hypothetical protein
MNPYEPPKTTELTPSFLNVKLRSATCPYCDQAVEGVPRKTFLGFQAFTCRQCNKEFGYPLFRGYRITYWVLLAIAVGFMFSAPKPRPNIFVLLMGVAVVIDAYRLWKQRK